MKKNYLSILLLTAGGWMNCAAMATLNLSLYIEGYYLGATQMQPCLLNRSVPTATGAEADTITIELHDAFNPTVVVESAQGILMTTGTTTVIFSNSVIGKSCYIAVKTLNAIQTWSSVPITMNAVSNYDFAHSLSSAYGNNMIQVDSSPDIWAFYNGDINQDENIDLLDFTILDYGMNNGLFGYYPSDLNCDGNVDLLDFPIYNANAALGIYSMHP